MTIRMEINILHCIQNQENLLDISIRRLQKLSNNRRVVYAKGKKTGNNDNDRSIDALTMEGNNNFTIITLRKSGYEYYFTNQSGRE